MSTSQTTTIK